MPNKDYTKEQHISHTTRETLDLQYDPDSVVLSCQYIESGLSFQLGGIYSCVLGTVISPMLFSLDDIETVKIDLEEIIKRRKQLFISLNSNDSSISCHGCGEIKKKKFKDVRFDQVGGCAINIQHYTMCNLRCSYCCYAQRNQLVPPRYSSKKIIEIFKCFQEKGTVIENSLVSLSGGEPALLKDLDYMVEELVSIFPGDVSVFSNCTKHSNVIAQYLRDNSVNIVTSIDAGTPSTFRKMKGGEMSDVIDTLIKYKETNTKNIWLKYIITEENRNEDDLFAFVFLMTTLQPNIILIIPEYPYGDAQIPHESVLFGAKLWWALEKYSNIPIYLQSDDYKAEPKLVKYSEDIRKEFARLCEENPLPGEYIVEDQFPKYFGYLKSIFETCVMNNNEKIALWGFGTIGRNLWSHSDKIKRNITVIIDSNEGVIGSKPSVDADITIQPPQYILDNRVDVIIITTTAYSHEIQEYIKNNVKYKVKIISCSEVYDLNP